MTLVAYEWRKLLRLPAPWSFLALCLAFNCLLLWENDHLHTFFNESSEIASELGQRVDGEWLRSLAARPWTEYGDTALSEARGMTDIFAEYDTRNLSGFYTSLVKSDPLAQRMMTWKYALLADRVNHLSHTGAAMDFYAGPVTHDAHQLLYDTLLRVVTAEAGILGMLSMLHLLEIGRASCRERVSWYG